MAKQKRKANLPDDNRVARRCGFQTLDRDPQTNTIRGIIPQALQLRSEIHETYLSVSWLEFYKSDDKKRLKEVVAVHRKHATSNKSKLGPNSAITLFIVGEILASGKERSREIRVTHRSSKTDPAYSKIEGLPLDNSDLVLLEMICRRACCGTYLIKEIDAWP